MSQLSNSVMLPLSGSTTAPPLPDSPSRRSAVVRLDPEKGVPARSYRVTLGPIGFNGLPTIASPSGFDRFPDIDWKISTPFATVSWGLGAAQYICEVDWPPQGCSFVLTADAINVSVASLVAVQTGSPAASSAQQVFSASIAPADAETATPTQAPTRTKYLGPLGGGDFAYVVIPACARDWKLILIDGLSYDQCQVSIYADATVGRKVQQVNTGTVPPAVEAAWPVQEWPRFPVPGNALIWSLQNDPISGSSEFAVEFGLDLG